MRKAKEEKKIKPRRRTLKKEKMVLIKEVKTEVNKEMMRRKETMRRRKTD
jgi:hypothetical protein